MAIESGVVCQQVESVFKQRSSRLTFEGKGKGDQFTDGSGRLVRSHGSRGKRFQKLSDSVDHLVSQFTKLFGIQFQRRSSYPRFCSQILWFHSSPASVNSRLSTPAQQECEPGIAHPIKNFVRPNTDPRPVGPSPSLV